MNKLSYWYLKRKWLFKAKHGLYGHPKIISGAVVSSKERKDTK